MGEHVRVIARFPPGHVRTPHYLRGKCGIIERRLGEFPNPEELAYGQSSQAMPLVRVRFTMGEVWGPFAERPNDTLDAEIFAHWLEATDGP